MREASVECGCVPCGDGWYVEGCSAIRGIHPPKRVSVEGVRATSDAPAVAAWAVDGGHRVAQPALRVLSRQSQGCRVA